MFTCEMFQVCNHSVLISSLGMGFGHRNGMGFGHRWTENIKRKLGKEKFGLQTANLQTKISTQQRIWDTTSTPKLWEESERTHWIGPKLSLKRSPEKQRKAAKKFLRYWRTRNTQSLGHMCV